MVAIAHGRNQAYEITGTENKNFADVGELITDTSAERITFNSSVFIFARRKTE
jgi:hypothetical protein